MFLKLWLVIVIFFLSFSGFADASKFEEQPISREEQTISGDIFESCRSADISHPAPCVFQLLNDISFSQDDLRDDLIGEVPFKKIIIQKGIVLAKDNDPGQAAYCTVNFKPNTTPNRLNKGKYNIQSPAPKLSVNSFGFFRNLSGMTVIDNEINEIDCYSDGVAEFDETPNQVVAETFQQVFNNTGKLIRKQHEKL